jgi:hypothetical protein
MRVKSRSRACRLAVLSVDRRLGPMTPIRRAETILNLVRFSDAAILVGAMRLWLNSILCPRCKTDSANFRSSNTEDLRQRAQARTLKAWCHICDQSWTLPEAEQALVEKNYLSA